jgi:iron complex outermembrane recepter protein
MRVVQNLSSFLLLLTITSSLFAQDNIIRDTVLQEVLVEAYASDRPLLEVPASIGYISQPQLNRFSNTNLLPAMNTIPGVRMEERSPGSYRFSIRGSLLRSPFGVRNVKVYWNGLPLTDGGGNTYLNLLDFGAIGSTEVIKGPAGSLYGAGTGGVVLLSSPTIKDDKVHASVVAGGYGLKTYRVGGQLQSKNITVRIHLARQEYDGYRQQSAMERNALNMDVSILLNEKATLSTTVFYTDLFYETPGGLTKAQFDIDPRQARPAGGPNPGAVEQDASVNNKTPFVGIHYEQQWDEDWSTRIGVFGSTSTFDNYAVANYEKRDEQNIGARTENEYRFTLGGNQGKLTIGGELQLFKSPIFEHDNNAGTIGNLRREDDLSSRLLLLFTQFDAELSDGFFITAAGSLNSVEYSLSRVSPVQFQAEKEFKLIFSPRIALLKKLSDSNSVYLNASRGFSAPSLAEVLPSTGQYSLDLEAETGTNYEFGLRGQLLKQLSYDFCAYAFKLNETIVQRRDATGAEYFINAGKTNQKGVELSLDWTPIKNKGGVLSNLKLWDRYSYNHYRFEEFASDTENFSGNKLTGIPPTINTTGLDLGIREKVYINLTASYIDHVPLNDANTEFADAYFLLGGRVGYKSSLNKTALDIFAGVDNLLDETYSLGNDLNAFGGRYYNAAAGRNFYFGVSLDLSFSNGRTSSE